MAHDSPPRRKTFLLTGLLAVIPLWITWLVLTFLFKTLSAAGTPLVKAISNVIGPKYPQLNEILNDEIFKGVIACVLVVAVIYSLGVFTTVVVGRQIFQLFENALERVPLVKHIYGAVKKLTVVLQEKPAGDVQRVVLIDFPSPEMKTVGLVTRVMPDKTTGRMLAAVYVPTTPNPTSGYLEIVPVDKLTSTDWTMDQAMSFIVSGGAIAPENFSYGSVPEPAGELPETQVEKVVPPKENL